MSEAIDAFTALHMELPKRKDIDLTSNVANASGPEVEINEDLPEDLKAFLKAYNGVRIKWRFLESPGGGEFGLMSAEHLIWKDADEDVFGEEYDYMQIGWQFDHSFYFLRELEGGRTYIQYCQGGAESESIYIAETFEELLMTGLRNGFVEYWPLADSRSGKKERNPRAAGLIERFQQPAVK